MPLQKKSRKQAYRGWVLKEDKCNNKQINKRNKKKKKETRGKGENRKDKKVRR